MDINWWMVSTGVLWVLGAFPAYAELSSDGAGTKALNWTLTVIWPVAAVLGLMVEGYDQARDYLRRKRG